MQAIGKKRKYFSDVFFIDADLYDFRKEIQNKKIIKNKIKKGACL